jgi:hypothetical protein
MIKLFQYWNDGAPPDDVMPWIERLRVLNPQFDHVLLDEAAGRDLIGERFGPRELAAFKACAVPAMQADYLRLCLMEAVGGLYCDVDLEPLQPLEGLISHAAVGLTPRFLAFTCNDLLMFRQPGNLYNRACLTLATDNLLHRRGANVLMATGPGVFNAVRYVIHPPSRAELDLYVGPSGWLDIGWRELVVTAERLIEPTPELVAAYTAVTQVEVAEMARWLGYVIPAYKQTDHHWERWKGSIYR